MKRLALLAPLALLSGCAGLAGLMSAVPPAPVVVADKTVLDEQLLQGAEIAYKAWRIGVDTLGEMGRIRGAKATQIAALDRKAYGALAVAEDAYKSLNGASYKAAIAAAQKAVADGTALLGDTP